MHQQIIWDTLKGSIWPQGAIPSLHGPYLLHIYDPPYFGPGERLFEPPGPGKQLQV